MTYFLCASTYDSSVQHGPESIVRHRSDWYVLLRVDVETPPFDLVQVPLAWHHGLAITLRTKTSHEVIIGCPLTTTATRSWQITWERPSVPVVGEVVAFYRCGFRSLASWEGASPQGVYKVLNEL
jgi:hypothetical protein